MHLKDKWKNKSEDAVQPLNYSAFYDMYSWLD